MLEEGDLDKVEELLDFIYLNTDRCCQDLCEGQECKYKVEEIKTILSKLHV
tara:strand:- start:1493 stop:1645 length:153 start_codon:yes stop_codon:yes gene_type:complete